MIRFPTSHLIAAATIVALGIWCYVPLSITRFFIAAPLVGVVSSIVADIRSQNKVAALFGFLFVLLPVVAHWSYLWIDYACFYDHNSHVRPYFEDGTIAEGVVYPIIYCLIYGTLASAMAFAASICVSCAAGATAGLPSRVVRCRTRSFGSRRREGFHTSID